MSELASVILFLIDQTSKVAKRSSQRIFDAREMGVTIDQWVLLKLIEEHEGLSQNELAERAFRDGASITRTLNLLEGKGYVARQPIPGNRRQYSISLSEQGKAFLEAHMPLVRELRAQSLKGFSDEEVEALKGMLLRIQKNVE